MSSGNERIAVYPASFDPITRGHLDVAVRAAAIFDQVILAVYDRPLKSLLFSTDQRVALAREAVYDIPNLRVDTYSGLTPQYARSVGSNVIVRGLRSIGDFDREWTLAQLYRKVDPEIEVVCLVASQQFSYVSSSAVKEIAELGGPIDELVPPNVAQALAQAFAARRG